jgi:hypothetical protein
LLAFALLLIAGCSLSGPSEADDLYSAMTRWGTSGYLNYEFTLTYACGECSAEYNHPLRIRVVSDRIAQVTDLGTGATIPPDERARTIPGLFAYIRNILDRDPYRFAARYDPVLGYPRSVSADPVRDPLGDEVHFQVADLTELP